MKRFTVLWAGLSLALLVSCHKKDNWRYSQIQSGSPVFSSARLSYFSSDIVNGIDLEFIALENSCHLYLSVHKHPLKPYKDDQEKVLIKVQSENENKFFIASRHRGGQRALLSESAQSYIVSSLLNNHSIVISSSGYMSRITPESFTRKYPLLQTPPRFKSPLHSPLT
jgi:hypothetical protein